MRRIGGFGPLAQDQGERRLIFARMIRPAPIYSAGRRYKFCSLSEDSIALPQPIDDIAAFQSRFWPPGNPSAHRFTQRSFRVRQANALTIAGSMSRANSTPSQPRVTWPLRTRSSRIFGLVNRHGKTNPRKNAVGDRSRY